MPDEHSKRVLVCGGRDYTDLLRVCTVLDEQNAREPIGIVIHGAALGADSSARYWATTREVEKIGFPAEWRKYGKAAGPMRNQRMIDEGKPDVVVAFPGGRGTADMVRRAEAAGIPVIRVD